MTARLALIGAPGAGKTSVGEELARHWGCPLLDTDAEFERLHARSVTDAVIDDEAAFREEETRITVDALRTAGAVVAVGSGAVLTEPVQEALRPVPTVWLSVGLPEAARRTGLSGARPVALGNIRGQLHTMLEQRGKVYSELATITVGTDGRSVAAIADEIGEREAQL